MTKELIRNLYCAVLLEAVKDYCGEISQTTLTSLPKYYFNKDNILSDLRSEYMVAATDGMSLTVADALVRRGAQIKENLQSMIEDFQLVKVETYGKPEYR